MRAKEVSYRGMRIEVSLSRNTWQVLWCAATLLLLPNCTNKQNLPSKIAAIQQEMASHPAASLKKLQTLDKQFPGEADVLYAIAETYLLLPGNNDLSAAVKFELAGGKNGGAKRSWYLAARLFAQVGDVQSQLENLCLHLQRYPDEDAWLDLGQILIQSKKQKHLEVAQQILFGVNADRPTPHELAELRADLQEDSLLTELSKSGRTASGLLAVETIRLLEPEDLPLLPLEEEPEPLPTTVRPLVAAKPPVPPTPPTPTAPAPPPPPDTEDTGASSRTAAALAKLVPLPLLPTVPVIDDKPQDTALARPDETTAVVAGTDVTSTEPPPEPVPPREPPSAEQLSAGPSPGLRPAPEPEPHAIPEPAPTTQDPPEVTPPEKPVLESPEPPSNIHTPAQVAKGQDVPVDPVQQGNRAFEAKEYAKASAYFWQAVRINPENPILWYNLSQSFYRQDHFKKAEMMALEAARRDPQNREYVVYFLKIIRSQEDPEHYHAELKRARKLFPDDPFIIYELAVSYANVDGDLRAAAILFNEFLEKHPDHANAKAAKEALDELKPE
jgi:hypothetical protein